MSGEPAKPRRRPLNRRSQAEVRLPYKVSGAACREIRAIRRKLDYLKPSLQKVKAVHLPERHL